MAGTGLYSLDFIEEGGSTTEELREGWIHLGGGWIHHYGAVDWRREVVGSATAGEKRVDPGLRRRWRG